MPLWGDPVGRYCSCGTIPQDDFVLVRSLGSINVRYVDPAAFSDDRKYVITVVKRLPFVHLITGCSRGRCLVYP